MAHTLDVGNSNLHLIFRPPTGIGVLGGLLHDQSYEGTDSLQCLHQNSPLTKDMIRVEICIFVSPALPCTTPPVAAIAYYRRLPVSELLRTSSGTRAVGVPDL